MSASEYVPLLPVAGFAHATTVEYAAARRNQKIQDLPWRLSCLARSLFCISCPCSCFCSCVQVNAYEDILVSRFGIVTDILREQGTHCINPIGLETSTISMTGWQKSITDLKLNDATGIPLFVSATFTYQINDALAATFRVQEMHRFVYEQAKSTLHQVIAKHPYTAIDERELASTLKPLVEPVGVQVNSFRLISTKVDEDVQKLLLARQEAMAYINGRKVVAEAACGIVKESVDKLRDKGFELSNAEKSALVSDLLYMICNHGDTSLRFYQAASIAPREMKLL